MKHLLYTYIFLFLLTPAIAQDLNTVVRGTVVDKLTGVPLEGINLRVEGGSTTGATQSDAFGKFSITVPVGRHKLIATSTGYNALRQEILAVAGKDVVINISLTPAVQQLEEVEVQAAALDKLAGQRSLTIEKTLRVPANFFDPVRVITAYPGVVAANDQGNSIIVRGNSPNGLLWKLNGADIVNPNHLSNAGTFSDKPMANGGGVNIISSQMINNTDFYMGQMPTAYGNALAGIIDMNLREGNKEKFEVTAQASLIGLDVAAEGPIGTKGNTSFLANARYSTVGLLSAAGVDFGDEAIQFHDFSFHLNHTNAKGVKASLFGFWGGSKNEFDAKPREEWKEDKDQSNIDYTASSAALGGNIIIPLSGGNISAVIAYSFTDQARFSSMTNDAYIAGYDLRTTSYDQENNLLSSNVTYSRQFSDKINWSLGVAANYVDQYFDDYKRIDFYLYPVLHSERLTGSNSGVLIQPFTSLHVALSPMASFDAGLRYVNYTYNSTESIEPRAAFRLNTTDRSSILLSYSLVSQQQLPQLYAANKSLELTKSHHTDLSYSTLLSNDFELQAGLFHQYLYDVPVAQSSHFSAINFLEGVPPTDLLSEGSGENYGADLTLEKKFFNRHDVLLGASYYRSTYIAFDGAERNSRFDGKYTFSAAHGKEWTKESKRRTIALSTRLLYLGGLWQNRILEPASDAAGETVFNPASPYSEKLADYFRLDIRLSFRKNKPGYTRTFAIDLQNVTNQQNEAYQYYDRFQRTSVMKYQLGIIPVLVYRIDF